MYSNDLVCDILDFIELNINRKISIEEISSRFIYNRYYIMKLFKKEIGITILEYINKIRIYNSMFLIKNSSFSFTKIALFNGFYSLEYFSETFHSVVGVSPRIFKFYCKHNYTNNIADSEKITNNWIELQELVNFCLKYKKKKKPNMLPVLKRSIFY